MKYRKKPVEIEAIRLTEDNISECFEFIGLPLKPEEEDYFNDFVRKYSGGMYISTLEGRMFANFGDYIIKGVKGEYYPCKPDIFEMTYEKVD